MTGLALFWNAYIVTVPSVRMLVLKVSRDDGTSTRYAFKADDMDEIRVEQEKPEGAWFLKFVTGHCLHYIVFDFEEKALELMASMTSILSTITSGEDA